MNTIRNNISSITIIFLLVSIVFAQDSNKRPVINGKELITKIDSIIIEFAEIYDVPGISVGVVQNGKSIYSKGYGFANLETKAPVTSKTLFKAGSVSKVITAIAVMQLVETSLVELDDKVIKHVKYFKTKDEKYKEITVRHLLTHTSGVPGEYLDHFGYENPEYDDDTIKRFVESMQNKNFGFLPGEKYEYSNTGFVLLSALVEEVTGIKFEKYISDNILKPAGITNSTSDFSNIERSKLARGHVIGDGFNYSVNTFFPDTRWITGADGFYASSDDMNKLAIALLSDYNSDSRILLKKETIVEMWTKGDKGSVGLCWNIYNIWGGKLIEHGGNAPGFSAEFGFFDDLGITVLCNSDVEANRKIMSAIIKTIKKIEQKPHKITNYERVLSVLKSDGINAGTAELNKLKAEQGENFNPMVALYLSLAITQGTAERKLEYAKEILEPMIIYYPDDEYLNLFLAEVYIRLAIKYYEKANTLLPGDWGVEKMYNQVKSLELDFYN